MESTINNRHDGEVKAERQQANKQGGRVGGSSHTAGSPSGQSDQGRMTLHFGQSGRLFRLQHVGREGPD